VNINSHPAKSRPVPGFSTPAVGFEAPFDMLEACHERVSDRLALLARLQIHLQVSGCDAQARQAAADVLRYFDLAAPLHHQDEEIHVFPPLLASPDTALVQAVRGLQAQHRAMEQAWARTRRVLLAVLACDSPAVVPWNGLEAAAVLAFTTAYDGHIRLEEAIVYPAARHALSALQWQAMSADMMSRRGVIGQVAATPPTTLEVDPLNKPKPFGSQASS